MTLTRAQSVQVGWLTAGALALFVGFRLLPTGTNLNHMDFRLGGGNVIEFCDPSNPQFLPVVAVRSPVTLSAVPSVPAVAGQLVTLRLKLGTAAGKPIGPADVVIAHTRPLHLMIVDPTLEDYQHVHPEPTGAPGEWSVQFQPRRGGVYRVFADFTPAATNRGLYASTDVPIVDDRAPQQRGLFVDPREQDGWIERGGFKFSLTPSQPLRAGVVADLRFQAKRDDGAAVPLQPVMGAFAHLVAFDRARTGFAHLHPAETDIAQPPDRTRPTLTFKVTIPKAGSYVVWAQVNVGGNEVFVPFWFDVLP